MPRARHAGAALLAAVTTLAAGCAGGGQAGDPAVDPSPSAPAATVERSEPVASPTPAESEEAVAQLDFTARTLDGGRLDGSSYVGRDVVLWMWAPW